MTLPSARCMCRAKRSQPQRRVVQLEHPARTLTTATTPATVLDTVKAIWEAFVDWTRFPWMEVGRSGLWPWVGIDVTGCRCAQFISIQWRDSAYFQVLMRVCRGLETCAPGAARGSQHGEATSGRHQPPPAQFLAASHHPCQASSSSHISLPCNTEAHKVIRQQSLQMGCVRTKFCACTSGSALYLNLQ